MWRKGNPPALLVGMYIVATTMENGVWKFLKKLTIEVTYSPVIPFLVFTQGK